MRGSMETNTLGQQFDYATHKTEKPTAFETNLRSALISLSLNLETFADAPNNDFAPQYKADKDAPRLTPAEAVYANSDIWNNPAVLRKVRFLSVERDGLSHDFPLRIEHPQGLLRLSYAFTRAGEGPVIFVTGLDGREHAFPVHGDPRPYHEEKDLQSTKKIAAFVAGELAKEASAPKRRPARNNDAPQTK